MTDSSLGKSPRWPSGSVKSPNPKNSADTLLGPSAGLSYCICCDLIGQQRDLQPDDSITAQDLGDLRRQAAAAARSSDQPLLYLAASRQAQQLPGICVLPDLLTALAVGVSNSAIGLRQQDKDLVLGLDFARQVLSDLLLSTAPGELQQQPMQVPSLVELAVVVKG